MRLEVYSSGQQGAERELIELLQIGSLAMTKVSAGPMESFVPRMQVFSIPYLFRDHDHFWNVLNSDLGRSEEHTSELQSRGHLVCRLLLEKKKRKLCNRQAPP